MKKTIITLLALAGTSVASVTGDWQAVFETSDQTITQGVDDYSAEFTVENSPLTLTFASLSLQGTTVSDGYKTESQVQSSAIRPNVNVCKSGQSYTLTFTVQNTSDEFILLDTITFNAFGYNSAGQAHTGATPKANFSISYTPTDGTQAITLAQSAVNVFGSADVAFSLGTNSIGLKENESCTIALTVSANTTGGSFVGLSGATFKVVPEPATATLSLLALAGLTMRRRRK